MSDTAKWKEQLTEVLVKMGLLRDRTEKIEINCNKGKVCDVKRIDRFS
jgi:hypothetical protein